MSDTTYRFLGKVHCPEDVAKLDMEELTSLAKEIRHKLIETCSVLGGHLAPGLGATELTVALHHVFQSPRDSIVFDTGHQIYPHKLITGRYDRFDTIRQFGGLSGFGKIGESEHDIYGAGHASTSSPVAMGMAVAKGLNQDPTKTIVVIGDGAMTGGLALSSLNQSARLKKNLLIILNDNEMSISENVGALASFLSRKSTNDVVYKLQHEIKSKLLSMSSLGKPLVSLIHKTKDFVKSMITPGMLFECFGFRYLGPIDGHSLPELVETLQNVKGITEPVLIHCITVKGKGYAPAEADPESFHGIGPFNIEDGKLSKKSSQLTYTQVFGKAMVELAQKDERIIGITAAMAPGTGLSEFSKKFPERFFDVGICEEAGTLFAAGLVKMGMKPIFAVYSTFLQRAYDQLVHDVCLQHLPVVFALDRAGIVGQDGPTHHGAFDLSYLRQIPGMVIMAPKDENELVQMLTTAVGLDVPVAIRYPRGNGEGVEINWHPDPLPLGKAEVLKSMTSERGLLLIASGHTVWETDRAAHLLEKEGIPHTLLNARFVKPLDSELILKFAGQSAGIVTVEENVLAGGFGSSVMEMLGDHQEFSIPVRRIGIGDHYVEHGTQAELRAKYKLDAAGIFEQAREFWNDIYKISGHVPSLNKKTMQKKISPSA
jgi:1-deoxy-D-xylulose-5-phosphate synthase